LDLTRPVKICLAAVPEMLRIPGRLPTGGLTSLAPGSVETLQSSEIDADEGSSTVWAKALPSDEAALAAALAAGRPASLTLVGRLSGAALRRSWDVSLSSVGPSPRRGQLGGLATALGAGWLHGLARLRARGCSQLASASLPRGLRLADLSSCAALERLQLPPELGRLEALDVSNCRRLDPGCLQGAAAGGGGGLPLRSLHLSYATQLPEEAVAALVAACPHLETVSLRGIATDAVVRRLAGSSSCRAALRAVDAAFSPRLGAAPVWELVAESPRLERFNLRGCRSIARSDYWAVARHLRGRAERGNPSPRDPGDVAGARRAPDERRSRSASSDPREGQDTA